MHRHPFELRERHQAKEQTKHADDKAPGQQRAAADPVEVHRIQIRQDDARFTAFVGHGPLGLRGGGGWLRCRRGGSSGQQHGHEEGNG